MKEGQSLSFRTSVQNRNLLVVTSPIRNFPLSRVANQLQQIEQETGLEQIVVQESEFLEGKLP